MKSIDFTKITACGECCVGCKKKEEGLCEGCLETDGHCKEWAESGQCVVHKCAKEHGVQFCGLCNEFPCDDLTKKIHWNSNVVEHLAELAEAYRSNIMNEQRIEDIISVLIENAQQKQHAFEFVSFLQASEMQFDRQGGYWEGKYYWAIWYKGKIVSLILISNGDKTESDGWTVWFEEEEGSDCFADFPVDERTKEIAWANVDIFKGDCGGGQCVGLRKTIFGKVFESLYRTIMCFYNPDAEEVECMKKLVEIRKAAILGNK